MAPTVKDLLATGHKGIYRVSQRWSGRGRWTGHDGDMGRVVCVGLTTWDVVQVADRMPGPDEKVVARDGWMTFGGPAANAAATCAVLGVPVRLVTALGSGMVADLARSALSRAGVEVIDLAQDFPDLLAVSSVVLSGAHRAVVSRNGAAAPDLGVVASTLPAVELGDVVLVDGHHLGAGLTFASRSRAAGAVVLADAGSWKPGLESLLAEVDIAVLSADFRFQDGLARETALLDAVASLGPAIVARSDGSGPLQVRGGDSIFPARVDVVDTLGAGDVLHGAIAAALAQGRAVTEALRFGVEMATLSVQYRGALGWGPAAPVLGGS